MDTFKNFRVDVDHSTIDEMCEMFKTGELFYDTSGLEVKQVFIEYILVGIPLPTIFLSYSWENRMHRIECLRGREIFHSIQTFLKNEWKIEATPLLEGYARVGVDCYWGDLKRYQQRRICENRIPKHIYSRCDLEIIQSLIASLTTL